MTPVSNSALTSVIGALTVMLATWLASKNIIPTADVSTDAAEIGSFILFAGGIALGWYKTRQVTQTAMIKSVNATSNGVAVVSARDAASAGILPVNTPVTGPEAPKAK